MPRAAGTKNKATIERELIAAQVIDRARAMHAPLALEKLIELGGIAMAAMAAHQPVSNEVAKRERERGNEKAKPQKGSWRMFGEWFDRATFVFKSLAPYQSPQLKAIAIAPAPPSDARGEVPEEITLTVFERGRVVKTVTAGIVRDDRDAS
jgi:hypothetical protein